VSRRQARIGDQIRAELARILGRGLRDPRVGFVTLTEVAVTPDLRTARVYVSVLGSEQDRTASLKALSAAAGWLRGELGRSLQLRYTPGLQFVADLSMETGSRIDSLLDTLGGGSEALDPGEGTGGDDDGTAARKEDPEGEDDHRRG